MGEATYNWEFEVVKVDKNTGAVTVVVLRNNVQVAEHTMYEEEILEIEHTVNGI